MQTRNHRSLIPEPILSVEPPLEQTAEQLAATVRRWLDVFVIDLNLCPFARREVQADRVRIAHTPAAAVEELVVALRDELDRLQADATIETTLLVHPNVLGDFFDYNDFLDAADGLLIELEYEGVFQIASFHPDYQFANTTPDAAENFANRSPYPLLHLLRESSVTRAVAQHEDVAGIPDTNIDHLNELGSARLAARWQQLFAPAPPDA